MQACHSNEFDGSNTDLSRERRISRGLWACRRDLHVLGNGSPISEYCSEHGSDTRCSGHGSNQCSDIKIVGVTEGHVHSHRAHHIFDLIISHIPGQPRAGLSGIGNAMVVLDRRNG